MSKAKKILISGFILFNLLLMMRAHLPMDAKLFKTIYKPLDAYSDFFSVNQEWLMFSPDPATMDVYITADVEFQDGTKDKYIFPRNPDLTWFEKYTYGEKFRKIIEETIRLDDFSYMWNDTARFALRKLKDRNFHKIPLRVHLTRHWNVTPPLKEKFIPHLQPKKNFESYKFYTYEVF